MLRQMKNSGIEWIGEIPANWELQKGKYLYRQRSEKGNSIELQLLSPTQKYGVIPQGLYEKISGMKPVQLDAKADLEQFKSIYAGDFCISLRSFQGGFEYSQYNGVVSPAYQVFYRQTDTTYDAFYRYIFKEIGFIGYMNSFTKSFRDGKSIAFDDFAGTLLPVPPIAEQHRIADFLDCKCAEIDAVIERTKATIEEYKKLKQAVITEAVTKGVHGPRPMKDSGIEWIGEIAEAHPLIKLKHVCQILDQYRSPVTADQRSQSGEVLYDYYGASGAIDKIDGYTIDDHVMLIGEDGANLRLRNLPLMYEVNGKAWINNHAHILKPNANTDFYYLFYALEALDINPYITGSAQPKLSQEYLKSILIPMPCLDEQREIAVYISEKSAALDTLIAKKTALLTELETYKKSLIYEYVTGKKEVL